MGQLGTVRSLFTIIKNLTGNKREIIIPNCSSGDSLTSYFERKTAEMKDTTDADNSSMSETVTMDAGT